MAHKVQAFATYGPRIQPTTPMGVEQLIEQIVIGTNQSRGSVAAVLAEIEAVSEYALKEGRIVRLPNGMTLRPIIKQDGRIEIAVRVSPAFRRRVRAGFRGRIINAENIGKSEQEIIQIWNENNPGDMIVS